MIWWNIKLLKQRLIDEGLSQKYLFVYIFLNIVLCELLLVVTPYLPPEDLNIYDHAGNIASIITISLGTYLIYRANGGLEGQQFAERFFAIYFVVNIRFLVFLIPIFLVFLVYIAGLDEPGGSEFVTTWYLATLWSVWYAIFYWRVIVHIKDVANSTPA